MKNLPVKIAFARKSNLISNYIQSETWSKWSHVVIVDGEHVIESIGIPLLKLILVLAGVIKNSTNLGGVTKTPLAEFESKYPDHMYAYIDGDIDIARDMVGKVMYDAWGVLGVRMKKIIDCDDKVSCGKLVWRVSSVLNDDFDYMATPQHILNIHRSEP